MFVYVGSIQDLKDRTDLFKGGIVAPRPALHGLAHFTRPGSNTHSAHCIKRFRTDIVVFLRFVLDLVSLRSVFWARWCPVQGYLAHKKRYPPLGPPSGPRHSPTVGSWGSAVSHERGTPVAVAVGPHSGLHIHFLNKPKVDDPQTLRWAIS